MNTDYIFSNEKFIINQDVYFTVDTTVIDGHRICKLKSLKIYYHGDIFEMKSGETVHKYIIEQGLRSIFSIELINYLNKCINYEYLYDIYSIDSKLQNFDQESSARRPAGRDFKQELSSFIIHDKSNEINSNRYKEGLISDSHFIKSELEKTRNPNFPICYANYDEIKNIPVYCYVHPSLAINQGKTVILCHIGYILEKLANYKRFPEFNTQAVISFINIVNEATRNNLTVEKLNDIDFKIEYEKLQKKYLQKKNKCKSLEKRVEEMDQNILDLKDEIKGLRGDLNTNTSILSSVLANTNKIIETSIEYHEDISSRDKQLKNKMETKLPQRIITTDSTDEVLLLFVSKSLNDKIHSLNDNITEEDIIINSISCQSEILQKELNYHDYNPETDKILFKTNHGNSLDLNRFVKNNGSIIKPLSGYIRKYVVKKSNINTLKEELDKIMNKSSVPRDEIIRDINKSEESLIKKIYNPISEISSSISNIKLENENSKEEIKEILSVINKKLNNLEATVNENKSEIKNINKEIKSLSDKLDSIKNVNVSKEILISLFGDGDIEIYSNKRYRPVYHKNNETRFPTRVEKGKIKESELLTYEKLMNSIIRIGSDIYKPETNKKLLLNNDLIMDIES